MIVGLDRQIQQHAKFVVPFLIILMICVFCPFQPKFNNSLEFNYRFNYELNYRFNYEFNWSYSNINKNIDNVSIYDDYL